MRLRNLKRKGRKRSASSLSSSKDLYNQGVKQLQDGRFTEAEKTLRKVLRDAPGFHEAANILGNMLAERGRLDHAESLYLQAIQSAPNNPAYHFNLGNLKYRKKDLQAAAKCFDKATELDPLYTHAHDNLGFVFHEMSELQLAIKSYKRSLEINPNNAVALNNLATSYKARGYLSKAEMYCRKSLEIDDAFLWAHMNLGTILFEAGRLAECKEAFRKCLEIDPDNPVAMFHLVTCGNYTDPDNADARQLARLHAIHTGEDENKALLHFASGKIWDDCGDYQKAGEHFLEANRIKSLSIKYDPEQQETLVDSLIETFSNDISSVTKPGGSPSNIPVFIVGMPRSGTSLVEQMISSHPAGDGVGEVYWIHDLAKNISIHQPYPQCLSDPGLPGLKNAAENYLAFINEFTANPQALRVANKTPANYFHLGLINLLFPQAKIIYCTRDPRDIALSLFSNYFPRIDYSYDLECIAETWLQQKRIMEHWKSIAGLDIHQIHYEDLVNDFEVKARELIEFIGLEWHEDCLLFYQNTRAVRTASAWQVRRPVYSSSVGRWKNYEQLLSPFIDKIGEW